MQLFESLDDLKPFIFRIIDNGGATADRFTIITCDGDYFASSAYPTHPQGFGMWGESIDLAYVEEVTESGTSRDLRWIDLPKAVRDCVYYGLNSGFADWLALAPVAASRDEALDFQGWSDLQYTSRNNRQTGGPTESIYHSNGRFAIRRDDNAVEFGGDGDPEFDTYREAALYLLPEDYDLAGPEYHTPLDLWDESDPAPLWDCEAEPPEPLDE